MSNFVVVRLSNFWETETSWSCDTIKEKSRDKKIRMLLNLLNVMKNSRCLVMYYSL